MSFAYEVYKDEELNDGRGFSLLEPGIYNFQVLDAINKPSQSSGNPMITLKLNVWDDNGKEYKITDYLVSQKNCAWKIKHFCESVGLIKEYEDHKFDENLCLDKCGKASIVYQIGKEIPYDKLNGKPIGTRYPDKNAVEDYVVTDKGANMAKSANDSFRDCDVPF